MPSAKPEQVTRVLCSGKSLKIMKSDNLGGVGGRSGPRCSKTKMLLMVMRIPGTTSICNLHHEGGVELSLLHSFNMSQLVQLALEVFREINLLRDASCKSKLTCPAIAVANVWYFTAFISNCIKIASASFPTEQILKITKSQCFRFRLIDTR